jgi:hypothetical protein
MARIELHAHAPCSAVDGSGDQQPTAGTSGAPVIEREMMVKYYSNLFPTQHMYRWLCYGNGELSSGAPASIRPQTMVPRTVWQWICHLLFAMHAPLSDSKHPAADQSFFQRRELCFTLEGDIFARYQAFKVRPPRHDSGCSSSAWGSCGGWRRHSG